MLGSSGLLYRPQVQMYNIIAQNPLHTNYNKAIRDRKYLAPHMPVLGKVHPIKILWKKLSVQFLRYAIELLHVKRRTRHKWR